MNKHLLLTASTVLALLFGSVGARAQAPGLIANERWACTEKVLSGTERPPVEFAVMEGSLVEQPLGVPRYKLLSNTAYGLIGVDYSTDLELGYVDIFVATVMIDRASGRFSAMNATSGGTPEVRTGQCKLVTAPGPTAQR
jgi:hypothetical protein